MNIGQDTFEYEVYDGFFLIRNLANGDVPLPALAQAILERGLAFVQEVIATESEILLKWSRDFKEEYLQIIQESILVHGLDSQTWKIP